MFENIKSKKSPIGNEFIKRGILTEAQVNKVLEYQKEHKDLKFAEIVDILDMCDKKLLLDVLSYKLQTKAVILDNDLEINPVNFLPRDVIINYKVIPFAISGNKLKVAFAAPQDTAKVREIELLLMNKGYEIEIYVTLYTSIMRQISGVRTVGTTFIDKEEKDITKLVDNIILTAIEKRASDIHFEPMDNKIRIRYRIDGILITVSELSKSRQNVLIGRLKAMSNMYQEIAYDQDGTINSYSGYSIRVSSQRNVNGEKFVLRILKKNADKKSLFDLGFFKDDVLIEKAFNRKNSMIVIGAPTGEGKTTTLYSVIEYLNRPEINIISIENPVERRIQGVNQVEIAPNITFASALRTVLRQDPDVILVGEIRDEETAKIAIEAGQTGHLVLSTIHAIDAVEVVTRIRKMQISNYDVASTIATTVSQRLVRRLCNNCKRKHILTDEEKNFIEKASKFGKVEFDLNNAKLYEPVGCELCNNTGYYERIGLFEVLSMDEYLKDMVSEGKSSIEIREYAINNTKYKPMVIDGIQKVLDGITTIDELKNKITL